MVTFSPSDTGGRVSVGAVADVLVFLRRWMVRQQHYGAVTFTVYVDDNKVSRGLVSPRVDPVLLQS